MENDTPQPTNLQMPPVPAPATPPPPSPLGGPEPFYQRRLFWVMVAVVAFLGFAYWYDQSTQYAGDYAYNADRIDSFPPAGDNRGTDRDVTDNSTKTNGAPARLVSNETAFQLVPDSAGTCTVLRPADWTKPVPAPGNQGADLSNADKSMYAGNPYWQINTSLAGYASVYQPPMNNPDLYSSDPPAAALAWGNVILSQLGGDGALAYTNETNDTIGEYALRSVASGTHKGVVFYHTSGFPASDGYTYILPTRYALTRTDLWASKGFMVARVAASLQCTATYVPRASSGPDFGSSSSSSSSDSNGGEDGYNPQLGTEYVHDQNTGENYLVDPSQNWSSDGPDGAGYYKANGNDYTKLSPGRSD